MEPHRPTLPSWVPGSTESRPSTSRLPSTVIGTLLWLHVRGFAEKVKWWKTGGKYLLPLATLVGNFWSKTWLAISLQSLSGKLALSLSEWVWLFSSLGLNSCCQDYNTCWFSAFSVFIVKNLPDRGYAAKRLTWLARNYGGGFGYSTLTAPITTFTSSYW